jgi:hypothetical protein
MASLGKLGSLIFVALLMSVPLVVPLSSAQSQTTGTIDVQGGSLTSNTIPKFYSDVTYVLTVNVTSSSGTPLSNSKVSFVNSGGIVTVNGGVATTNSQGIATMTVTFTSEGLVNLVVGGASVATLTIWDTTYPAVAFVLPGVLIAAMLILLGYAVYVGPVRWWRE